MHRAAIAFFCCALAAAALAAPAPLPRSDKGQDDLRRMQGTWRRLSLTTGGPRPVTSPLNDHVLIAGNRITFDPGKGFPPWVMKLGTGKPPRTFDIKRVDDAPDTPGWTGLYELQGDTLRICFAPGRDRPRSMQPKKEGECLQVLKRLKR